MDINKLMDKTGLSINEMCALTDVNRDTLYKWRSGIQGQSKATNRLFMMIEWLYDNGFLDDFRKKLK